MTDVSKASCVGSKAFKVETDNTAAYGHNSPANILPLADMMGAYMRNRPVPTTHVEGWKAWIIGSGIAGRAATFYMIRDGGMAGEDIIIRCDAYRGRFATRRNT